LARPRLLNVIRRWYPLLILGLVVPAVLAFLVTRVQPQVHQSSATLLPAQLRLAGNPDFDTVSISRLVGMSTNYAFAAKSHDLLSAAAAKLNLNDSAEALSKRVDTNVDPNSGALKITARGSTADGAAALANALAQAIQEQSAVAEDDKALSSSLESLRNRTLEVEAEYERLLAIPPPLSLADSQALLNSLNLLRELSNVYESLSGGATKTPGGLVVADAANPLLAQQIEPRTLYFVLLAAAGGLLVALGIASTLEFLDDMVRRPEDVEDVADVPTLGTIASSNGRRDRGPVDGLVALSQPGSRIADSFRSLRTGISYASVDAPLQTMLVTGLDTGVDKSITAANLAVTFAQGGRRVLLVDADLRRPGVHALFDVSNAAGLTTLLRSESVELESVVKRTDEVNLRILTTGTLPPSAPQVLDMDRVREVLDQLKADGDLVIIDGPSLDGVPDSLTLSSFVDGTLLVITAGRSRREAVRLACDALERARARLLGVVIYGRDRGSPPSDHRDQVVPQESAVVATRAGERRTLS
jgi:succinoglycan biosynthesis transport protein ExoP